MAFRIKNITKFVITVHNLELQPGAKVDLSNSLSNVEIRNSLLTGELYHKIQGRMVAVFSPPTDWEDIGLSTEESSRLIHSGLFIGYLTNDELKHPFTFNEVGHLNVTNADGVDISAVVQNTDPGPYADGEEHSLRLDDQGRLIVSGTNEGVIVKGVYLETPLVLADGYDGYILLSSEGRVAVEDKAYDPVAGANKIVPVTQTFDNHESFNHSQTVDIDSAVVHYIDSRTFPFWTLLCTSDGYVDITIKASNETTESDLALRNYVDITIYICGVTVCSVNAVTPGVIIVDTPFIFDSYKIIYTPIGLATWTAEGKKGSF